MVAACLRGDQDAWEELVRSHAGLVYTVLRRCGIGDDEAADLFQEVWVAAWEGLGGLRDQRGLAAWLATVATRAAMRALRRRIRRPTVTGEQYDAEVAQVQDPVPRPDELAVEHEQSEAVRVAIDSLSERDRQLVHAFFYDPAAPSYAEIADRLGVSPETVGPLRTRCLLRLRRALGDRLGRTGTEA